MMIGIQGGRAFRFVVLGLTGVAALHTLLSVLQFVLGTDLRDFIPFYAAAKHVVVNGWYDLYDLSYQEHFQQAYLAGTGRPLVQSNGFYYPPSMVLFFLPLTQLSTSLALTVWLLVNTALAAVTGFLAVQGVTATLTSRMRWQRASTFPIGNSTEAPAPPAQPGGSDGIRPTGNPPVFWLLLPFMALPVVWGIIVAQPVGLFTVLHALAFLALLRRADASAGLWLGLLTMVKPHLAVGAALLLLVQRRGRALVVLTLCIMALASFSLLAVGLDGVRDYIQLFGHVNTFRGSEETSLRPWYMVNWRSWFTRVPGLDDQTGELLTAIAGVVTLAGVAFAWRRPIADAPTFAVAFVCFTAAGLLGNYQSHYQDLATLLVPSAAVAGFLYWALQMSRGNSATPQELRAITLGWTQNLRDRRLGGMAAASFVLLAGLPGLAWLLFGLRALGQVPVWALLGAPGLLLLVLTTLPRSQHGGQSENQAAAAVARRR